MFEHQAGDKLKAFTLVLHVTYPMEGTISMKAFIAWSATSKKWSMETLAKEIKPVAFEKKETEKWDMPTLKAFYGLLSIHNKRPGTKFF